MSSVAKSKSRHYLRPVPALWWLKRPNYTKFMVRELTSGVIAAYALFLLVLTCGARGADGFHELYASLSSPGSMLLHLVALFCALFHTVTFFNLTPRAIVVHVGEEKVPEGVIQAVHYVGWVIVSVALFALVLWS